MKDTNAVGNYYCIASIVQFTGLTDRTIRNYISSGILEGEKINGLWHFTPEQVENFVRHPAVRPSILAKSHGAVYDHLLNRAQDRHECCIILDMPGADRKEMAEFFCYSINAGEYSNIHFSFDGVDSTPRIILTGETREVLQLVNSYYEHF